MRLIDADAYAIERYPMPYRGDTAWYAFLRETHIPTDIAQRLGIEPKEG